MKTIWKAAAAALLAISSPMSASAQSSITSAPQDAAAVAEAGRKAELDAWCAARERLPDICQKDDLASAAEAERKAEQSLVRREEWLAGYLQPPSGATSRASSSELVGFAQLRGPNAGDLAREEESLPRVDRQQRDLPSHRPIANPSFYTQSG